MQLYYPRRRKCWIWRRGENCVTISPYAFFRQRYRNTDREPLPRLRDTLHQYRQASYNLPAHRAPRRLPFSSRSKKYIFDHTPDRSQRIECTHGCGMVKCRSSLEQRDNDIWRIIEHGKLARHGIGVHPLFRRFIPHIDVQALLFSPLFYILQPYSLFFP